MHLGEIANLLGEASFLLIEATADSGAKDKRIVRAQKLTHRAYAALMDVSGIRATIAGTIEANVTPGAPKPKRRKSA